MKYSAPVSLALVVFSFTACCHVPHEPHGLPRAKARWKVDVTGANFAAYAFSRPDPFTADRQIAFGSNDELVVVRSEETCNSETAVNAVVLNAQSGEIVDYAAWWTKCWAYVFPTAQGRYAVVTNNGMALYSPGLKEVVATIADVAADKATPDGRLLAAWRSIPGHGVTWFLDADTLRSTGTKVLDQYARSVAENRVASLAYPLGPDQRPHNESVYFSDGKSTVPVYDTGCPKQSQVQFISSDTMAVLACGRLRVVNATGGELFSEEVNPSQGSTLSAISRDGRRFALRQVFERPGDPPTTCTERITVFDLQQRRAVFAVDLNDLKGMTAGSPASGVALSPNGSLLAVNSRAVVRLYRLP
jgi:hypothetical protein